ncbi:unnamed protein product, partial [Lymnaea stagnalis]
LFSTLFLPGFFRPLLFFLPFLDAQTFYWIGANDIALEQNWVWEDDKSVATELSLLWYTAANQPTNVVDEDCALIYLPSAGPESVFDDQCNAKRAFLCMVKDLTTTQDPTITPDSNTTPDSTTNAILTSTANIQRTTLMKCGANSIYFNVALFLNLFVLIYVVI